MEVSERQIKETKQPIQKTANKRAEVKMLISAIRRLEISTAIFVQQEQEQEQEKEGDL